MKDTDKQQILELKAKGLGYKTIAKQLNLPLGSITSFFNRMKKCEVEKCKCKNCGISLKQTSGHRQKTFCSDKCRMAWWKTHQDQIKPKKQIECTCLTCGKTFLSYPSKQRKYCSKECYVHCFQIERGTGNGEN